MKPNSTMPCVIIVGAGFHAKALIECLKLTGKEPVAILDDNPAKEGMEFAGVPVGGPVSLLPELIAEGNVHEVAIGFANIRLVAERTRIFDWISDLGLDVATIIHPGAYVSPTAQISPGLFMGPNTALNTDSRVGRNVSVYTGTTIDHDNVIEDHVFFSPGVHTAGQVHIESEVYIGPGAIITSGCRIGAGAIIGAGSVVLRDVPPRMLAVGVPARIISRVEEWERKSQ